MQIALLQKKQSSEESPVAKALRRAGLAPVELEADHPGDLSKYAGYIVLRANKDQVLSELKLADEVGKPILGLGEGAGWLVQTGLVPGLPDYRVGITMAAPKKPPMEEWVFLKLFEDYQFNAFTRKLTHQHILRNRYLDCPGEFHIPPGLLMELEIQGLTVFHYCDAQGRRQAADHIAAVSNKRGNVMAMPTHPEYGGWGELIFQAMYEYLEEGHVPHVSPLNYFPRHY